MGEQKQYDSKDLDELYYNFAQAVLAYMTRLAEAEGMPQTRRLRIQFNGASVRLVLEEKDNYFWLLMRHMNEEVKMQEEVEKCARVHWMQGILRYPKYLQEANAGAPATFEQHRSTLFQQLFVPLQDALDHYETLELTREQILESYHQHRNEWMSPNSRYNVIIPLLNFTSEVQQQVPFGTQLQLAPFTPQEKTEIWNEHGQLVYPFVINPIEFNAFHPVQFKLSCIHHQDQDKPFGIQDIDDELIDLLTALRLLKAGNIGAPGAFARAHARSIWLPSPVTMGTSDYGVQQYGAEYNLSEAEIPTIKALYSDLQKLNRLKHRGGLAVALRRFNQAYSRGNDEDKIIDLTISLESCLLSESEELTYRLSLRGAALLAKIWEPRKAQLLLKAMYATRSAIVHSGQQLSNLGKEPGKLLRNLGIQPHEFRQECENMVRAILKTYVGQLASARGRSVEIVIKELDELILQGLTLDKS